MGFFNFIETFFFISLAITFILIIMLVYHFKDRLSILENKTTALTDIMNNMVKELIVIKKMTESHPVVSAPPIYTGNHFEGSQSFPSMFQSLLNPMRNKIIVSDDDSDNSDSDSDSDSDNDNDSDSDNDNDESKIQLNNLESIILENEIETIEKEDHIELVNSQEIGEPEEIGEIGEPEEIGEIVEPEEIGEPEEIVEPEEIGEPEEIVEPEEIGEQLEESKEITETKNTLDTYKSLDISKLKSLVLEKGLAQDVKKLKKNDLIKLLSDNQ